MVEELAFGSWLKQRRKEQGLSQEELAEKIGCSLFTLRKLESGERHPSGQVAQLLADHFQIAEERGAFIAFARTGKPSGWFGGGPSSTSSRTPWKSGAEGERPQTVTTNLPSMLTSLIGREKLTEEAVDILLNSHTRLLTLTGAPGIGKTRLGLQVAGDLVRHFEDGVFLVELATVVDPDMVLTAIAQTLGLKETEGQTIGDVLHEYAHKRKMLLLLDNFEQVLDAAPAVVRLLESSPQLKVLVTSREVLHVRGERRLSVPPLDLPEPSLVTAVANDKDRMQFPRYLEMLAASPSVELFVDRARSVAPDFVLGADNAYDVAEVCTRLEGLPLAIELAAARADRMSPRDMHTALGSRLKLLTGGPRDLPARQHTLKSAIEWSYALLSEKEQSVFRTLSVFVGGCAPEAIEALFQAEDESESESEEEDSTEEYVDSLLNKSLLRQDALTRRLTMLEMIREYALDLLVESGHFEAVQRQHALYYFALSGRAERGLRGAEQVAWLDRLEAEHDNLRAAMDWAEANEEVIIGLRIAGAIWRFWELHSHDREGIQRLNTFIHMARLTELSELGRSEEFDGAYSNALIGAATLIFKLGGDSASALGYVEESLEIARRRGDRAGQALAYRSLAQIYRYIGEVAKAHDLASESVVISREVGDKADIAGSVYLLGIISLEEGTLDRAQELLEESVTLRREMQEKAYLSKSLIWLGEVARSRGDMETASASYEEALSLHTATGIDYAYLLHNLGHVVYSKGDYERAKALFAESLVLNAKDEDREAMVACLAGLAAVAAQQGDVERAGRLFGHCSATIAALNMHMDVADRLAYENNLAQAQALIDNASWERAWAKGQAMSLDEAIEYALR